MIKWEDSNPAVSAAFRVGFSHSSRMESEYAKTRTTDRHRCPVIIRGVQGRTVLRRRWLQFSWPSLARRWVQEIKRLRLNILDLSRIQESEPPSGCRASPRRAILLLTGFLPRIAKHDACFDTITRECRGRRRDSGPPRKSRWLPDLENIASPSADKPWMDDSLTRAGQSPPFRQD